MCLFHDWDNKECRWPSFSNALMPDNKQRICKKCGGKQVWIDYPLHGVG